MAGKLKLIFSNPCRGGRSASRFSRCGRSSSESHRGDRRVPPRGGTNELVPVEGKEASRDKMGLSGVIFVKKNRNTRKTTTIAKKSERTFEGPTANEPKPVYLLRGENMLAKAKIIIFIEHENYRSSEISLGQKAHNHNDFEKVSCIHLNALISVKEVAITQKIGSKVLLNPKSFEELQNFLSKSGSPSALTRHWSTKPY